MFDWGLNSTMKIFWKMPIKRRRQNFLLSNFKIFLNDFFQEHLSAVAFETFLKLWVVAS